MSQSRKRHAGCAQLRPGALPAMSLVIIAAIVADAIVVLSIVIWAFRPDLIRAAHPGCSFREPPIEPRTCLS